MRGVLLGTGSRCSYVPIEAVGVATLAPDLARVLKPTKKDQNREPPPNAGGERPPNRGAPGCLNFVPPIYLFGDVKVLCAERRLVVSGREVSVGARAFDLLVALVERRERVVSKEELLSVVWPGLVVEEANIQVQVSTLRKLIGKQAPITVAGRGYRFSELLLEAEADASAVQRTAPGQAEGDLPIAWQTKRTKVHLDALIASRSVLAVMPFAVAEGVERHYAR